MKIELDKINTVRLLQISILTAVSRMQYKKLNCRREAAQYFMSLNISLSLKVTQVIGNKPFDRSHTSSYWRSIATVALSRIIS